MLLQDSDSASSSASAITRRTPRIGGRGVAVLGGTSLSCDQPRPECSACQDSPTAALVKAILKIHVRWVYINSKLNVCTISG